jgi:hypothetical protein
MEFLVPQSGNAAFLDLHLRADGASRERPLNKRKASAALYLGTTKALDLHRNTRGLFKFEGRKNSAQFSHLENHTEWAGLREFTTLEELAHTADKILPPFVAKVAEAAGELAYVKREGGLQTALGLASDRSWLVDREVIVSFESAELRRTEKDRLQRPVLAAISNVGGVPGRPSSFGDQLYGLAVDDAGRLLVIEAKHGDARDQLCWTPAQVAVYANLVSEWIQDDESHANEVLNGMIAQRHEILDIAGPVPQVDVARPVVPVVATTHPVGEAEWVNPRMSRVADSVSRACPALQELQVWQVADAGEIANVGLGNLQS